MDPKKAGRPHPGIALILAGYMTSEIINKDDPESI